MADDSPSMTETRSGELPADLTGTTLGEFRLQRRLGEGGMGQVYLAEQLSLLRRTAVKVMRPELTASPSAKHRFRTEALAVARLSHPNIVQIFAVNEQDGLQYMALEFIEGSNVGEYLVEHGRMPIPLALSILKQVAGALEHAGEQGIVHRDIKPENILLQDERREGNRLRSGALDRR
jgi:serine/threonine-protein kinase